MRGIVFDDNVRPPSQPICVLVEFDDYCGPSLVPQCRIVPIVVILKLLFSEGYAKNSSELTRRIMRMVRMINGLNILLCIYYVYFKGNKICKTLRLHDNPHKILGIVHPLG